jgi:hypothetical protein
VNDFENQGVAIHQSYPESIWLRHTDKNNAATFSLFSGDTLLVGDVG